MASIVNLTPHTATVLDGEGNLVAEFPSSAIARARQTDVVVDNIGGVPIVETTFGEVVDLPDPVEGVYLIVSIITLNAARAGGRSTDDLLITSGPVRDETGRIIGCKALGRA